MLQHVVLSSPRLSSSFPRHITKFYRDDSLVSYRRGQRAVMRTEQLTAETHANRTTKGKCP